MKFKDIELKYKINAYRISKEYPNKKDILFDMLLYIQSTNKRKKNWNINEFKINFNDIEKAIPLFIKDKELIKKLIGELFNDGYITYNNSNIEFPQKAIELFYKI